MPPVPCALHVVSMCYSSLYYMHRLLHLRFNLEVACLAFAVQSAALPWTETPSLSPSPPPPVIVHQFPPGTALENQCVRSTQGDILVTLITAPEVYLVAPNGSHPPLLAARFPGALSLGDIVEISPNIFFVATTNLSLSPPSATFFASSIWQMDLTTPSSFSDSSNFNFTGLGKIKKVANIPQVGLANGMAVLNSYTILLADIWLGVV
ncbi:hypothetical protein HYFRA_00012819 [Hymenoscyphus fraxineus]|uniref:Uncharacterized protein n=1 Tax=Hymenoscyphus fraxineus TaxID=746836 RepID=A0A9N9L3Y8_9HELO|nr:hypothetical protein HYFRA_00012819 [Hymenoscyphus fraxineus]